MFTRFLWIGGDCDEHGLTQRSPQTPHKHDAAIDLSTLQHWSDAAVFGSAKGSCLRGLCFDLLSLKSIQPHRKVYLAPAMCFLILADCFRYRPAPPFWPNGRWTDTD